jgi:hypothetical protein
MGAWVTGSQTTTVDVRADIRPSLNTAAFDLNVTGQHSVQHEGSEEPCNSLDQR